MANNAPRTPQHEPDHDEPRKRTRKWTADTIKEDPFDIPQNEIPPGLSYEWKRWSNKGEDDPYHIARMREQGWEVVPPSRHPTWVPHDYDKPYIMKGGQILMDRPMELTLEARAEMEAAARRQMKEAKQRLGMTPNNTLTRDHPETKPRVQEQYMRPVAIEED